MLIKPDTPRQPLFFHKLLPSALSQNATSRDLLRGWGKGGGREGGGREGGEREIIQCFANCNCMTGDAGIKEKQDRLELTKVPEEPWF